MFANFADSGSDGGDGVGGVELKYRQKIFMSEGILHPAPCHQDVCRADHDRFPEPYSDGIISILFQKRICNDADDVTIMVIPEFFGQSYRYFFKNSVQRKIFQAVILLKRIEYRIHVFLFQPPQIHRTRVLPGSCVGKIVHIFQFRGFRIMINQRNPLRATADIPAHGFVPCIVVRTGSCFGTLGINHELFVVGIFVQPGGGIEECSPVLQTVGELSGGSLGEGGVIFVFGFGHPCPPSCSGLYFIFGFIGDLFRYF
ncbi:MAG: hypothetical protein IJX14_12415 [Clostridia bacterium]|nr:hypothetical protein [Clostridia bacterium]